MADSLRFVLFGAGFWARYQLAAWRELGGVQCVAVCDPQGDRAAALAREFGVAESLTDAEAVFTRIRPDFVDVVSAVPSHAGLVFQAAAHRTPVICQKPLTDELAVARRMVGACAEAGVPLFVHENFRWQAPLRAVRQVLDEGTLGRVIRARIDFVSGFPVFDNQPALRGYDRMILADLGVHTLDVARFLCGEFARVYCQTQRVRHDIAGEDVATVCLEARTGATVVCNLAYAGTPLEREAFPQTLLFIEGDQGSLSLEPGYALRVTTAGGTRGIACAPPAYPWADPAYGVVHASIVPCNQSFLRTLRGEPVTATGATTGADNLETLRLVFAAYQSAAERQAIAL